VLLVYDDFGVNPEHFEGDVICFISMLLLALYLVMGRRYRSAIGIWSYIVPLYAFAGVICLIVAVAVEPRLPVLDVPELLMLLGLVLIPTIVGHSLLNVAMRRMRGQIVSIANTGQAIFAGAMALLLFGELPSNAFYVAAVGVVAGIVVSFTGRANKVSQK
jgi:drug/metabolite transporter (DMT)-like permease